MPEAWETDARTAAARPCGAGGCDEKAEMSTPPLPAPTLRRMPAYLRLLRAWEAEGRDTVSCTHLAEALGLDPTLIRKDLQLAGGSGRPKTGYRLAELVPALEAFLGWSHPSEAFVIGAGNLGLALLHYQGFAAHGLSIVAAFDDDARKVGTSSLGKRIFPLAKLADLGQRMGVRLGILCVPEAAAQAVAETCCAAGMRGLWNFTGARLQLPEGTVVEDIDLAQSLALLSHRLSHRQAPHPAASPIGTAP